MLPKCFFSAPLAASCCGDSVSRIRRRPRLAFLSRPRSLFHSVYPARLFCLCPSLLLSFFLAQTRVLSRPLESELPRIYQELGTDFDDRVLPSLGNEVRRDARAFLYVCVHNGGAPSTVLGELGLCGTGLSLVCVKELAAAAVVLYLRAYLLLVSGPTFCSLGSSRRLPRLKPSFASFPVKWLVSPGELHSTTSLYFYFLML